MEQDSSQDINRSVFTADQQAKLTEVEIRKRALETQLNLVSQEETLLRDKLQEENQEKNKIKQEIDSLLKIKDSLKPDTPTDASNLRESTIFSKEVNSNSPDDTMKCLLDKEISSLEQKLNEIPSKTGFYRFIVYFDNKKLYELIVQDKKILQLKYFNTKNDFIGVVNNEIWNYFRKENENNKMIRHVSAGETVDKFEVLEENYYDIKTINLGNKICFLSKMMAICLMEKQENKIKFSEIKFKFDRNIRLVVDDNPSIYCTDQGNTLYRFDEGKHSNEVYFKDDHFGINAESADKVAVLFKDKVCFFNKRDLKKTKTFVHDCHPEERTRLKIIGGKLGFIAKGMFCIFSVEGTKIAKLEINAVNFANNSEYFAVLCKRNIVLVDTDGKKLDTIELGTKIPKDIDLFQ